MSEWNNRYLSSQAHTHLSSNTINRKITGFHSPSPTGKRNIQGFHVGFHSSVCEDREVLHPYIVPTALHTWAPRNQVMENIMTNHTNVKSLWSCGVVLLAVQGHMWPVGYQPDTLDIRAETTGSTVVPPHSKFWLHFSHLCGFLLVNCNTHSYMCISRILHDIYVYICVISVYMCISNTYIIKIYSIMSNIRKSSIYFSFNSVPSVFKEIWGAGKWLRALTPVIKDTWLFASALKSTSVENLRNQK